MVKELLLILLGLDIGTASPHFAALVNDALTHDRSHFMSEWHTDTLSFIIEAVIFFVICVVLVMVSKWEQRKDTEKTKQIINNANDNNKKIVDLLGEIKDKLGKQ